LKVLIVYPELHSFSHKALGVSILTGILKRQGHTVALFDSSMYDQTKILPDRSMAKKEKTILYWFKKSKHKLPEIVTRIVDVVDAFNEKLQRFSPDIILVSATYLSYQLGINLITESICGNTKVIFGGIHCTLSPEEAIQYENVKYMHVGEGELSLPSIMDKISGGSPIDDCPNLWVKKNGTIIKNPLEAMMSNIDELPFYDWDNYSDYHFMRLYSGKVYKMGDYSTSRGCVNSCSYCFNKLLFDAYDKKKAIRRYSAERAIEELVYLKEKYGITFIKFHDSDFLNMNTAYMEKFTDLYQKHVNLPNTVNGCVEHVTEDKARFLVRMNCKSISIGLESGNEELRKQVLNRGKYTNQKFIDNTKLLKSAGLRVSAPCMIGLPGETRKDILDTIRIAKAAEVDHADFGIFFPFPRLPLTEYAIKNGYLEKDKPLDDIIFGVESALTLEISHEQLRNLLRCSMLYLKLPNLFWPLIDYAEQRNTDDGSMWKLLRKLYFFKQSLWDISAAKRKKRRRSILKEENYLNKRADFSVT
jgi:radical SAM superfamily enzyme YgiQ (UPF0313 family)